MIIFIFIANALFILGLYNAFREGQIFGGVHSWLKVVGVNVIDGDAIERRLIWLKPFISCFVCMPTIWGELAYFIFAPYEWYYFPIYVLCLSGFMYLIKLKFFE